MTMHVWPAKHAGVFDQCDAIEHAAFAVLDDIDPSVTAAVRIAAATNLGNRRELAMIQAAGLAVGPGPRSEIAARFTEQFVIDVAAIDDDLRGAIGRAFGAETFAFVQSVYVIDVFQRARLAFERLFEGDRTGVEACTTTGDLWADIELFMRSVALLADVDPVVTELVRLRGARVHQCRLCQSRLSAAAVEAAGSEEVFSAAAVETTTVRQRAAVDFADVLVTQPSGLDQALIDRVRKHFTNDELAEIILDVVRNAANKIAVAFGADAPNVVEGVEYFAIDESGEVVASVDIAALL